MASACEFPEELVSNPLGYVALTGLDVQHNAMHRSIWDTFTVNRRQDKVLNIKLLPGDADFPKRRQKQRTSYEFYIPKGILKTNWMNKHLNLLPALVVVFFDLDWNDPQWREKQTECASRVAVVRSSLFGRNTKIAVVLIQKNIPLPPGEDPQAVQRAEALCQACELASKSLFVLPFSDHLQGYVTRLEGAFYDIAQTHYSNEARVVKQHKDLLNKSQHQLLFSRHQFKVAFYNELRQDPHAALKHYKQAYQHILEHRLTDVNNLEVKIVAGFVNYKICRISFQLNAPLDAISQFRKHIDYFKSKIGCNELAFEHSAWMAKQFSLFGDLFQEAIKNGLQAIQTQHPGFYYQQAANHSMMRMKHCRNLCRFSEPVHPDPMEDINNLEFFGQRPWRQGCQANEAPDPSMEQAGILSLQALELKVEHFWIVIPLLSSAVAQFREYKSVRMKLFLMVQMGEEYFEAKDYEKALTLLHRVTPFYRGERWWDLLRSVLRTAIRCSYLTVAIQDYVTLCLELIGNYCSVNIDEKTRLQTNLLRIVKKTPPDPENNCSIEYVEKAKELWKTAFADGQEQKVYTVDMEHLTSFIECRVSFDQDVFRLDEVASVTVYIRSVAAYPIRFSELGLQFSNQVYNSSCIKTDTCEALSTPSDEVDGPDLFLEPYKTTVHSFKFILAPSDVHKKLEVKQVYLKLGQNIILRWKGAGLDANVSPSYDSSNYGGERIPVKHGKDGNILWDSVTISPFTDVVPRPAEVSLEIVHDQPCIVDEFYKFNVNIHNKESVMVTNTRLLVKIVTEEGVTHNATLYLDEADGGDRQAGLNQVGFDLENVESNSQITKTIYLKSSELGAKSVSFEVSYNMGVVVGEEETMVDCVCSKEEILTIETQMPFSISVKVANMKFQQINQIHTDEPFTLITYVKCTSPWPVDIISSEFLLSSEYKSADEKLVSQIKGLKLKQGDVAGECQCLLAPSKQNEHFVTDPTESLRSVQIGQYLIQWRRTSGGTPVYTKVNLPVGHIQFVPFYIKTDIPSHGCVQEAMLFQYTICNRTSLVQEVEAAIQPSDAFMLAGTTQMQFRVLPHGEHTLSYSMFPLFPGELPLPKLHINLPHLYNLNSNALAQQMLTTHVYIKPKPTLSSPHTPEIQVQ